MAFDKEALGEGEAKTMIKTLAHSLRLMSFMDYESIVDQRKPLEWNLLSLMSAENNRRWKARTDRKLRESGIPEILSLEDFEMTEEWLPHVDFAALKELRTCEFIRRKEDVLFIGPTGRGKTHLSLALGREAVRSGFKVAFKTAAQMVTEMTEAKCETRLSEYTAKIAAVDLLVLDELGYGAYSKEESHHLFRIISERHRRRSTIVASNFPLPRWESFIAEKEMAAALVDRMASNSHIFNMNSPKGYRFAHAKQRRGESRP
jgi:DNA replication protein DnaC